MSPLNFFKIAAKTFNPTLNIVKCRQFYLREIVGKIVATKFKSRLLKIILQNLKMGPKHDPLTGVKSFAIGGRMIEVRQRCMGMTDDERRWRAQFLKDQVLSPNEPRNVPELYKNTTNIFRRLWKGPIWRFQLFLVPLVGKERAFFVRHYISKTCIMFMFGLIGTYYVKYYSNNWTMNGGVEYFFSRPRLYLDDPGYPNFKEKKPQDYYDQGFYSSPFAVKVDKSKLEKKKVPEAKKFREDGTEIICVPPKEN